MKNIYLVEKVTWYMLASSHARARWHPVSVHQEEVRVEAWRVRVCVWRVWARVCAFERESVRLLAS
jgi:hypothetical protein